MFSNRDVCTFVLRCGTKALRDFQQLKRFKDGNLFTVKIRYLQLGLLVSQFALAFSHEMPSMLQAFPARRDYIFTLIRRY